MITRIRDVRRSRGFTLAEVASRCSPATTAQTIGRLETGMRTVSMGWLARIAAALEVQPTELVMLPDRADLEVTALLSSDGAVAPTHPLAVSPPMPAPGMIAIRVEVSQGDYRARDVLWLERLAPARFGIALNRDVLAPRPVGRFAFGRLAEVGAEGITLVPIGNGTRPIGLGDVPWIAVARILVRAL